MFSHKADGPLTVQIPASGGDRPSWSRVGVITAIGFIVGVAWPRLVGVRLGPSVPESASPSAMTVIPPSQAALSATAPSLPTIGPSSTVAPALAAVPAPAAPMAPEANVTVGHGVVFACRTAEGDSLRGGDCGSLPGLDRVVMPRLHKLAECPEAAASSGKLHLVVHVDFARDSLGIDLGRGHGVSSPDALLTCARAGLGNKDGLAGIAHDNPRYSVAYAVTFAGDAATPTPSASNSAPARPVGEGEDRTTVQVVWEVAIVRDAPKTGKVVARLQHGAELRLGAPKDGWYPVKFGEGFAGEGWLYRGAIGR
jgi:hypothetical protein